MNKSPELVHAEAELARLREASNRLAWERDTLKQAHEQITQLGNDATLTQARDLASAALTLLTQET